MLIARSEIHYKIAANEAKGGRFFQVLNHEMPALQAQLGLLESKHSDAKRSRAHVDRASVPPIDALACELEDIGQLTRKKLSDVAEAEKQEKIVMIKLELERLRSMPLDEGQLISIEEHLQQLPTEDEQTKELVMQLQKIRADKEMREAFERSLQQTLASISQRLNELDATAKPLIESTTMSKDKKKISKKQQQHMAVIEAEVDALNAVLSQIEHTILPQLDELSQHSQQSAVQLPSLQAEHQRAQKIIDECKVSSFNYPIEPSQISQKHFL